MAEVCCDVIGALAPLVEQRGQRIGLETEQDCIVWGQREQLGRLLQNLIDNASIHGSPSGDIEVTLRQQDGRALLTVSNDGKPIADADLELIFLPYYRLAGSDGAGHGLGLAIVKEITGQLGGTIVIGRKADGQGTQVALSLPLRSCVN